MNLATSSLVISNKKGLYCPKGDFYIDPWRPVDRAIITHAHSDHARVGAKEYWAAETSVPILKHRLGEQIFHSLKYGKKIKMGEVLVSLHPAGHVLGSAQVRIEYKDEVWLVSGDYKRTYDPSCEPFEVVECDSFITESTFGLPIYHWESGAKVAQDILDWFEAYEGPSLLFCYAFGKAQRILAELGKITDKPIYIHGSLVKLTELYREAGIEMAKTIPVSEMDKKHAFNGELILAPPSGHRSAWMKRFKKPQTAFASGWMLIRGNRRRRGYEKGFVLSDHADWNELIQTIDETKAKKIYVTHGQNDVLSKYLRESKNLDAYPLETLYEGEGGAGEDG